MIASRRSTDRFPQRLHRFLSRAKPDASRAARGRVRLVHPHRPSWESAARSLGTRLDPASPRAPARSVEGDWLVLGMILGAALVALWSATPLASTSRRLQPSAAERTGAEPPGADSSSPNASFLQPMAELLGIDALFGVSRTGGTESGSTAPKAQGYRAPIELLLAGPRQVSRE